MELEIVKIEKLAIYSKCACDTSKSEDILHVEAHLEVQVIKAL